MGSRAIAAAEPLALAYSVPIASRSAPLADEESMRNGQHERLLRGVVG